MKIDIQKINRNEKLGEGSFGKVYPYQKKPGCQKYVVKVRNDLEFDKLKSAIQEVIVGFNLDHPSILSYKDFHIERSNENPGAFQLYITMPRMKMSLKQLLDERAASNQRPLSKAVVIEYIKTLLSGLRFLARKKIAHRDIKPANILVSFQNNLVIADLGEAKHSIDEETTDSQFSFKGTLGFMAPELLSSRERHRMKKDALLKADVWSMGVTILEICLLGKARTSKFLSEEARKVAMFKDLDDVRSKYGNDLTQIISSMLHCDPNQRKSIEEVCSNFEQKFYHNDLSRGAIFQDNNRHDREEEEEKVSNQTSNSLTPFNTYDPQQNPSRLCFSLPEHYRQHYNSVVNKEGEEKMKLNWQHLFNFKFDDQPTISLSLSQRGFVERSSRFQEMIKQFSNTVEEHKMKLPCFNIDFRNFSDFTNQNLNQLVTEINKSLPDLKELSLNFAKCLGVNRESIGSLKECFRKNKGLEKLSLSFDENPNIRESFLAELSSDIKENLRNLKSLTLSFENCREIPHVEVIGLSKSLESLTNLEDLDLNFRNCPNVGPSIKSLLEMTLRKSNKDAKFKLIYE